MKIKMNILDFIIIFIVIAVLAVGGFLFSKVNKTSVSKGAPAKVEFMMEVKDLTEATAKSFEDAVGKTIVYGTKNTDTAVVTKVEIGPYKRVGKDLVNGIAFWDSYPNEYSVMLTVETNIYENEKYFVGDAEEIRVGKMLPFSGEGIACPEATILTINKLEGGLK